METKWREEELCFKKCNTLVLLCHRTQGLGEPRLTSAVDQHLGGQQDHLRKIHPKVVGHLPIWRNDLAWVCLPRYHCLLAVGSHLFSLLPALKLPILFSRIETSNMNFPWLKFSICISQRSQIKSPEMLFVSCLGPHGALQKNGRWQWQWHQHQKEVKYSKNGSYRSSIYILRKQTCAKPMAAMNSFPNGSLAASRQQWNMKSFEMNFSRTWRCEDASSALNGGCINM